MSIGDWGPFWVGLSVPVCCSLKNLGNYSMFSCIEHKTLENVACLVALSTKTLGNVACFSCTEHKTPWKMKHKEKPPEANLKKISQLENSDFGGCWAGYLNSKICPNYFLKYAISNSTRNVFGINIDLPSRPKSLQKTSSQK